jgi:hypothetical protein
MSDEEKLSPFNGVTRDEMFGELRAQVRKSSALQMVRQALGTDSGLWTEIENAYSAGLPPLDTQIRVVSAMEKNTLLRAAGLSADATAKAVETIVNKINKRKAEQLKHTEYIRLTRGRMKQLPLQLTHTIEAPTA